MDLGGDLGGDPGWATRGAAVVGVGVEVGGVGVGAIDPGAGVGVADEAQEWGMDG